MYDSANCYVTAVEPKLDTSNNDSEVYPGKTIVFTCETRATDNQIWKVKYLGGQITITTNYLELGTLQNSTHSDNVTVHAMLVESRVKNDFRVMKSVLLITILQSTGYDELSIVCQNNELSTNTSITLPVGGPSMSYHAAILC